MMIDPSRLPSMQTVHGFCVSILPQTLQISIFSIAVSSAAASGAINNSRFLMRCNAARRAERGPSPGSRASSWINRSISGPATAAGMSIRQGQADWEVFTKQNHPKPNPGGSGKPPVTSFIFSCNTTSALRRASACAATMRSSRISFSEGFISESSILTPLRSPLAVIVTVTMPPPAVPSTAICSSSACIACILDCSCAACFIRPRKSAMSLILAIGQNVRRGFAALRVLRHADDLGARKAVENGLHQRIGLHAALDLRLLGLGLGANCRGTLLLRHDHDPALAGPAGQLALEVVHKSLRRGRLERNFQLAIFAAHQAHIAFERHLDGDVAFIDRKRDQFLERPDRQSRRRRRFLVPGNRIVRQAWRHGRGRTWRAPRCLVARRVALRLHGAAVALRTRRSRTPVVAE